MYVTSTRLTDNQKDKLLRVVEVMRKVRGRSVSQGEAVEALADLALGNRGLLADPAEGVRPNDSFWDTSLTFDLGRTDERTHDRALYGRR